MLNKIQEVTKFISSDINVLIKSYNQVIFDWSNGFHYTKYNGKNRIKEMNSDVAKNIFMRGIPEELNILIDELNKTKKSLNGVGNNRIETLGAVYDKLIVLRNNLHNMVNDLEMFVAKDPYKIEEIINMKYAIINTKKKLMILIDPINKLRVVEDEEENKIIYKDIVFDPNNGTIKIRNNIYSKTTGKINKIGTKTPGALTILCLMALYKDEFSVEKIMKNESDYFYYFDFFSKRSTKKIYKKLVEEYIENANRILKMNGSNIMKLVKKIKKGK